MCTQHTPPACVHVSSVSSLVNHSNFPLIQKSFHFYGWHSDKLMAIMRLNVNIVLFWSFVHFSWPTIFIPHLRTCTYTAKSSSFHWIFSHRYYCPFNSNLFSVKRSVPPHLDSDMSLFCANIWDCFLFKERTVHTPVIYTHFPVR